MVDRARLSGLEALKKNLAEIDLDLQTKFARQAVSGGAYVIVREARRIVKTKNFRKVSRNAKGERVLTNKAGLVLTGALLENIAAKREKNPGPGLVRFSVGVRHGPKAKRARKVVSYNGTKAKVTYENDPFYFWMLEFGTSKMEAKPFLRPAFEAMKEKASGLMVDRLRKNIEKFKAKYK